MTFLPLSVAMTSSFKPYSEFTNSMMAAMAVFSACLSLMSDVTFLRAVCAARLTARSPSVAPLIAAPRTPSENTPAFTHCATSLHTRCKKRQQPSTPSSLHSRSLSGGDANSVNSLAVSAPNLSTISSGSTVFPFDLDIFDPPSSTIPCVSRRVKGSSTPISPMSCRAMVKKRAYIRCSTACSTPPMY
ncbi:MAG: hypothetical protein BWY85_02213 [Firmicutes bacterium ADurb.Bin506]|nr:MAG: hypothetical protein BWY85_02213 [Firmicutes bacterium ADurb.Bin506]